MELGPFFGIPPFSITCSFSASRMGKMYHILAKELRHTLKELLFYPFHGICHDKVFRAVSPVIQDHSRFTSREIEFSYREPSPVFLGDVNLDFFALALAIFYRVMIARSFCVSVYVRTICLVLYHVNLHLVRSGLRQFRLPDCLELPSPALPVICASHHVPV